MKSLKKHLAEYEIIRRAASGEEGEIDQTMIIRAVHFWSLSGYRRLKTIDDIVKDTRATLEAKAPVRRRPVSLRSRKGGIHLRKKVRA